MKRTNPQSSPSARAVFLGAGLLLLALIETGCQAPRASVPIPTWYESEFKPLVADYRVFEPTLRNFARQKAELARRLAARFPDRPVYPDTWRFFAAAEQGDWRQAHHFYWRLVSMWEQPDAGRTDEATTTAVWYPVNETFRAYEIVAHAQPEFLRSALEITNSIPPGSIYFGGSDPGRFLVSLLSASPTPGEPFFALTQNTLHDGAYLDYVREMVGGKLNLPAADDLNRAWAGHLFEVEDLSNSGAASPGETTSSSDDQSGPTYPGVRREINGEMVRSILELNPTREGFLEGNVRFNWNNPHLVPHGFIFHVHREPLSELSDDIVRRDRTFWERQVQRILGRNLARDLSVTNLAHFLEQVWVNQDLSDFAGDPDYLRASRPRADGPTDANPAVVLSSARLAMADLYLWREQTAATASAHTRMAREADLAYRQTLALYPYDFAACQSYLDFLASQQRFEEILRLVEVMPRLFPEKDLHDWQQQWHDSVTREKSRL